MAAQILCFYCTICFLISFILSQHHVGSQENDDKVEPRPNNNGQLDPLENDFFLNHGRIRTIRSTIRSTDSIVMNFSNMNITDTRLKNGEFLIKIENSTTTMEQQKISVKLSQNKLTNLQSDYFASIKNLHELDVSQNSIVSIKLRQSLPRLVMLNLSHNNLDNFPSSNVLLLQQLPQLQILDLSSNKFNSTQNMFVTTTTRASNTSDAAPSSSLSQLDLSCNQFSSIDDHSFANLSTLLHLDVSFNAVSELKRNTFYGLRALETLNLASNDINNIHNDTFLWMLNLQYLDVSNNRIQVASIRALQSIADLRGLSIAYNAELSDSLQGFVTTWSLKELDGSGIGLCEIPAALTQSVKFLNLADNNLQIIRCGDLDSYPLLHKLVLSSNEIHFIEDDALGRLEIISILYVDNNLLDHIPISLPSSLIELHLEHNNIAELNVNALTQLKSLEIISFSGNPIIYLPGLPLPHLLRLNVRSCRLENVNQLVVKMSPRLKDIYLEDNPIKCADLLGIAEWATPCRDATLFDTMSATVMYDDNYVRHYGHSSCCCKQQQQRDEQKHKKNNKVNRICHVQPLLELESGRRRQQQQQQQQKKNDDKNNSSVSDNVTTTTISIQLGPESVVTVGAKRRKQITVVSSRKKYDARKSLKTNNVIENIPKKHLPNNFSSLPSVDGSKTKKPRRGHAFEEHFDDIQHPFDHRPPPPLPLPASSSSNCSVNTSAYAEQWVDTSASQVTGHPGLFMVIGVTIGMITAFGLVHLYKRNSILCKIAHRSSRRYEMNNYVTASPLNYHHRDDLLHMDQLTVAAATTTTTTNCSSSSSSQSPIELW